VNGVVPGAQVTLFLNGLPESQVDSIQAEVGLPPGSPPLVAVDLPVGSSLKAGDVFYRGTGSVWRASSSQRIGAEPVTRVRGRQPTPQKLQLTKNACPCREPEKGPQSGSNGAFWRDRATLLRGCRPSHSGHLREKHELTLSTNSLRIVNIWLPGIDAIRTLCGPVAEVLPAVAPPEETVAKRKSTGRTRRS
jgi:hypothetical protein